MSQLPNETSIPFALFRFGGEEIAMHQRQFEQALRDARVCRCNTCLACRAAQYAHETDPKKYGKIAK